MMDLMTKVLGFEETPAFPSIEEDGGLSLVNFYLKGLKRTTIRIDDTIPKAAPRPRATVDIFKGPKAMVSLTYVRKMLRVKMPKEYMAFKKDLATNVKAALDARGSSIGHVYFIIVTSGLKYPESVIKKKTIKDSEGNRVPLDLIEDIPTAMGTQDWDNLAKTVMDMLMREQDGHKPIMAHDDSQVPMGMSLKVRSFTNFINIELYHSDEPNRKICSRI